MFPKNSIIIGKLDSSLVDKSLIGRVIDETSCEVIYTDTSRNGIHAGDTCICSPDNYQFLCYADLDDPARNFVVPKEEILHRILGNPELGIKTRIEFKASGFDASTIDVVASSTQIGLKRRSTMEQKIPSIDKYIVNERSVVVFFSDGTKTAVVCTKDDKFDLEVGIEKCILKKIFGQDVKSQIKKVIKRQEDLKREKIKAELKAKEEQERAEKKRKKNYEKKLKMRANYQARYEYLVEQEKKKLKAKKILKEDI